jgi:hypothetical protein
VSANHTNLRLWANSIFWAASLILVATVGIADAQPVTCSVAVPAPAFAPASGESELVSDLVLTCTTTEPSQSISINVIVTLNTNVTSRITNTTTLADEALLLIDDPKPGVVNTSNTFPYFGQVLGTPGILAGESGSGNVYQGMQLTSGGVPQANAVLFEGVPYVTGGTRTFRITNIRANIAAIGVNPINAFVSINTDIYVDVANPEVTVAYGADALKFAASPLIGAVGLDLSFAEKFPEAFKKRIENTTGGPLTLNHQDDPGTLYCTQSGFTPGFESLPTGKIGVASTGTRLLAVLESIPAGIVSLAVPNQVTSSSGELVAHRVLPPLGVDFAAGTVTTATGDSTVAVSSSRTAELLYEVTAVSPYLGINGCGALDTFNISVIPSLPISLSSVVVGGLLAPRAATGTASPTAPEPRF